jgi:cytochrome c2
MVCLLVKDGRNFFDFRNNYPPFTVLMNDAAHVRTNKGRKAGARSCFQDGLEMENLPAEIKAKIREPALILATALGLFVIVYGLVFMLQPETAADSMPEPLISAVAGTAAPTPVGRAKAGAGLFARNCADCHGDDAKGNEGPSLYDLTRSDARISTIIKEGVKGEMPRFVSKFNDEDIQSLIAFLRSLRS